MSKPTFTDEDWETKDIGEMFKSLPPKTQNSIQAKIDSLLVDCFTAINCCESPIEQLLVLALMDHEKTCDQLSNCQFTIEPQTNIRCGGRVFRVDILIQSMVDNVMHRVVVECDGHDFHEKTKEQAAKDKQRDRLLIKYGYKVVRFTGSEIYNDPQKCAREILGLIFSNFSPFDVE